MAKSDSTTINVSCNNSLTRYRHQLIDSTTTDYKCTSNMCRRDTSLHHVYDVYLHVMVPNWNFQFHIRDFWSQLACEVSCKINNHHVIHVLEKKFFIYILNIFDIYVYLENENEN